MKQYIVDAFTDTVFGGNPAAVCVMENWLADEWMRKIAMENNLSETAFCVRENGDYRLRWFTPGGEIDLCGHATLAAAFVITRFIDPAAAVIRFATQSGVLTVVKDGAFLCMDFPSFELNEVAVTDEMEQAVGRRPVQAFLGADLVCVLNDEDAVRRAAPDFNAVKKLPGLLLHITAPGKEYDCVTRSFAPKLNVAEDPVCGRGHCHIIPLWAGKLGKNRLAAYQASARGGELFCTYKGARTSLGGRAVLFAQADIRLVAEPGE